MRSPRRHDQHLQIQPTSAPKAKASITSVSTAMVMLGRDCRCIENPLA
jgi:hypothetical protein